MKIAMVHLNLATESGDPRMAYLLAGNIKKAGHTVIIYTAQFDPNCFPELNKDLDVREVRAPLGEAIVERSTFQKIGERIARERINTAAVRGIAAAMDNDFDAVICENDQSYKLGKLYRARNPRAKYIWVMNNAPFRHTPKGSAFLNILSIVAAFTERLRSRTYIPYIDKVVVHDEEQRELVRSIGRDAQLLPIPVNFEKFYREVRIHDAEKPMLLGVGSLTRARNYEDIISAGLILRRSGVDCRIVLVCKDFWKNTEYRDELTKLAKDDGDGSWVDFRFNGVGDPELLELQSKAFAFIFPNHIRIWGMAAFEAMAAGLPLVVSNSTSVAEVLKDDENALFTNPGKPHEIAEKVNMLLKNKEKYRALATAGQEFVRKNLNWDEYVKNFLNNI